MTPLESIKIDIVMTSLELMTPSGQAGQRNSETGPSAKTLKDRKEKSNRKKETKKDIK